MDRLRLFPLRTVLFPGMDLDLQVFEERYRLLVAECIESGEPFGVVLIKGGPEVGGNATTHNVGCTAEIRRVTPTRDGRLALKARGARRFRIRDLHDDQLYLSADVEYPVDESTDVDEELIAAAQERLRQWHRLRDTIAREYHRDVVLASGPGELADQIGGLARGLVTDRQLQAILSLLNVRRRLEVADEVLATMIAATHQQAAAVIAQRWAQPDRRN